jgi:hypothetical protein
MIIRRRRELDDKGCWLMWVSAALLMQILFRQAPFAWFDRYISRRPR